MPSAYLFDIGNVIICFDFSIAVRRIEDACELPEDEILPALEPLAEAFERGEMSVGDFVRDSSERIGYSGSGDRFIRAFEDIFTLNEPIADLIAELDQAGAALYLLSNTNAIHEPFFIREWADVFDRFHGAVYSHEAGCMKPDREIYEVAIQKFDLEPKSTVYIDDREENIVAGNQCGLNAIQYDAGNHAALMEALGRSVSG